MMNEAAAAFVFSRQHCFETVLEDTMSSNTGEKLEFWMLKVPGSMMRRRAPVGIKSTNRTGVSLFLRVADLQAAALTMAQ